MITLYHAPYSCSLAVKAALVASGAKFKTQTVNLNEGEHLKAEFLKVNPLGKVPAIEVKGQILTEGAAINQFIAEKYPESNLLPEQATIEKANALKWLHLMYSSLHSAFARAFSPDRFGEDLESVKQMAEKEIHKLFILIDAELGRNSFIAGDKLTIADLYLMTAIHWESILEKPIIENYQNIERFEKTMFAQPVVGKVFRQEYIGQ